MAKIKPMKFFLPGIFLFALGLGNIIVGEFKGNQYKDVCAELSEVIEHKPFAALDNVSPLRRIQLTSQAQERVSQKLKSAEQRLAFYNLVSIGGAIFVLLSIVLLVFGSVLQIRNKNTSSEEILPLS